MPGGEGVILAIDPGSEKSAFVLYAPDHNRSFPLYRFGKHDNTFLLEQLPQWGAALPGMTLAIEMIASYGMPVGREVFETCVWIGRFVQAWPGPHQLVYRREVKLHLCGSVRAKDGNVRQALIDRHGGATAIGKKASKGPLYGCSADVWAALGVAVYWTDTRLKAARLNGGAA